MNETNGYTIKVEESYNIQKINNDKFVLKFIELDGVVNQMIINHQKFREKVILSTFSNAKLKHLIARCEEILKERGN